MTRAGFFPRARLSGLRAAAIVVFVLTLSGLHPGNVASSSDRALPRIAPVTARDHTEHVYRIIGKVRLLLFWASADDVGGARISWHGVDRNQSVSLLIGSDPGRAPRQVNEWGYIREAGAGDLTTVFGIRTVTDGDSPADAEARRTQAGSVTELGVLCSSVSPLNASSRTATVYVDDGATYRDLGRVLHAVERHGRWNRRGALRPSDTEPGFLTALDRLIRSTAAAAADTDKPACGRFAYIYKDAVYDLFARRVDRIRELRTRARVYHDLLRSDIVVRNRASGSTSSFSITYGTTGPLAGVPVTARYQPNWWFKVELELDDEAAVPPDPIGDASVNRRIDALCSQGMDQ
jgi:hypothetical protein